VHLHGSWQTGTLDQARAVGDERTVLSRFRVQVRRVTQEANLLPNLLSVQERPSTRANGAQASVLTVGRLGLGLTTAGWTRPTTP